MKNFNNKTGKNKGKLQVTKLAKFLNKNEATLRALKRRDEQYFNIVHLGALCKINNIDIEKLMKVIEENT